MEDDLNGKHPQWNTTSMEYNLNSLAMAGSPELCETCGPQNEGVLEQSHGVQELSHRATPGGGTWSGRGGKGA